MFGVGNVTEYVIPFDDDDDDEAITTNRPSTLTLSYHQGATRTPRGRQNSALRLRSSHQYLTITEPHPTCFSNLHLCHAGICLAFYLKISDLAADIQLVNTHDYSVRHRFSSSFTLH